MRRVKQRSYDAGDCGIACAAMVAGCTYKEAHEQARKLGLLRGKFYYTSHADVVNLLKELGVRCSRERFRTMRTVLTPAIVKVNPRGRHWHWVVLTSRAGRPVLLDPNPDRPGSIVDFRGYRGAGVYLHAA